MTKYKLRPANRQHYSAVSIHFLLKDLEAITAQAVRYGIPRHSLLTRAIKHGLPLVLASLEAKAARASQTKDKEQQHGS